MPGFGVESTADKIGVGLAAATAAGLLIHGIGRAIVHKKEEGVSSVVEKDSN